MASDAAAESLDSDGSGSALVDRWIALDRGWQALALGLVIVAVHLEIQIAASAV